MINELIEKIKQNKKYKTIDNSFVKREIDSYLKSHPEISLNSVNKQTVKEIIKEIRARLHRLYSSYQTKKKRKKEEYLEELRIMVKENKDIVQVTDKLLVVTISSKERLPDYEFVYSKIFEITGKPEVIVDIGSGLNPVSYPYMNLKNLIYYSYDINDEDVNFLNKYFKIMKSKGLKGKAFIMDIRELKNVDKIPRSDIVFIFKLIDLIDGKKKVSEDLIKKVIGNTGFIVVSFATRTLTRKPMRLPRRIGFELMLKRIGLEFNRFSIKNEVFYVIRRESNYQ